MEFNKEFYDTQLYTDTECRNLRTRNSGLQLEATGARAGADIDCSLDSEPDKETLQGTNHQKGLIAAQICLVD